jgi:hypothetical protein
MDDRDTVEFLPFNAINQFMISDYRLDVLREVLANLDRLSPGQRSTIVGMIKRLFKLPGFRNPTLAPLLIKVRGAVSPFEKNAEFTAQVLADWAEIRSELMQQVYHFLKDRGWEILPLDADRTKIPGFLTRWPKDETYEVLNQAFNEKNPLSNASDYDVRLMIVWVSGRLPYDMVETGPKN